MDELFRYITFPDYFFTRLLITGVLLALNPPLRYIAKKFIRQSGFLSSKSELRTNRIIRLVCIFINFSFILSIAIIWGVDPSRMLLVFSSVFAVIGVALFAQWSILSNITAGIIIFFSMPFRIGDEIEIIDKEHPIKATIENVLIFTIHLRSEEGDLIVMSNTQFMQKVFSIKTSKYD